MRKCLELRDDYVTCVNCDCCYDQNNKPTFCQRNGVIINPDNAEDNQRQASLCQGWFPKDIGRVHCSKDYDKGNERWYEKDSMA